MGGITMLLSMVCEQHVSMHLEESAEVCMCHIGERACWIHRSDVCCCKNSDLNPNSLVQVLWILGLHPLLMWSTNLSFIERKKKKDGRQERERCKGQLALQPDVEIYNPPNSPSLWQHVFTDSHYLY